eukprot:gene17555-20000_t
MNLSDLYNSLFVRKSVNDGDDIDGHFELPTLHMIFLHLEWFVNSNKLEAVASLVSNSVRTKKGDVLEVFNALVEDERFLSDLIALVGDHYQYAYSAIAEGIVTIPLGLAPTYRVFKCGCVRCGTPKYIRSFCLKCGHVHDESRDVKYTQITTRKHRSRSNNNSSKAKGASTVQNSNTLGKLKCANESPSSTALGSVSSHSSLTGAFSKLNGMKSSPIAASTSATNALSVSSNASMNSSNSNNKFTVFSLQALMAAKKEKQRQTELNQSTSSAPTTATSSTTMKSVEVISSTVDEVEIVVIKVQPVVIDLVSDDSDGETETHPAAPSPHTKAHTSLPSTAQHTSTKPTLLVFGSSRNHTTKYTNDTDHNENNIDDDADLVPVKMEKCSSQGSFMSECNSTIDSGDLDVDLGPVKLEWPAQRMNKYEMAAMRGIASLYKYGQSGVNPGDMLFLMRNLATNCSGLHRIAARCGFTKLCKQWAAEHPKQHLDDDNDTEESHERYVADVIEGAFTLAQLINPANRSWAMYQETHNATASSTMTTAAAGPNSNNGSSNSHLNSQINTGSGGCTGDTIWEDAEGNQESENDFAARIDLALNCSNLRFMIYSLTGDRHYQSLKSDVFEEVGATVDLLNDGDQRSHSNASKKQRTDQSVNHTLNGFSQPIVLPAKSSLHSNTNTITNKQSSSENTTNHNAAQQRQSRPRACNTTRSAITHLTQMETMSELYGNYDNFGNVSEAIATQFMDFAAVVTTCKYYIQQNFGKVNVWDFIGVDLDKELKETAAQNGLKRSKSSGQCNHPVSATITSADQASHDRSQRHNNSNSNSHMECNPHRGHTFTGALCWPYIAEEVGFDIDLRNDKNTLTGSLIRHRTLSKAVSRLASRRVYHSIGHFVRSEKGSIDREAYKQQCYFVTHVIYAFSDYGQHPLRRQLFIEEYKFIVTNTATVIEVLEDAELVGEFLHCLRVLQYTPARDPDLEQLFQDGMDFLLQREKHYGCMGRWVATCRSKREDIYTQYHACYCAVVGLAGCAFAQDEELIFNPPVSRILHHL